MSKKKLLVKLLVILLVLIKGISAQSQAALGDLLIKLLCFLFFIFPAILTLLFIVAGFLILRGAQEKRTQGKKIIFNAVIAFFILILLTWILTLTSSQLNFSDFAICFLGGEPPEYPTSSTLPKQQVPWADAKGSAFPPPAIPEKDVYCGPGCTVYFDGSESIDFDGNIVSYDWDFGDGSTGSGETTSHLYSSAGFYEAKLTVTDNDGLTDTDLVRVYLKPLEAYILKPIDGKGFLYLPDVEINFSGEGKYGTPCAPPSQPYTYRWESNLTGFLSNQKSLVIKAKDLGLGQHKIKFTVTDCVGKTAFDNITIYIVPPLAAQILKPKNDGEKMGCPAEFKGNVSGGKPPYEVTWKADGKIFATGMISVSGGIHSINISTPIPGLSVGKHDITFEAEDSVGLKASDEKKDIEIKRCYEIFDLVFVAVGNIPDSTFKSYGKFVENDFLAKTPFKDCPNPKDRVKFHYLGSNKCKLSGCSHHCYDCISKARQCIIKNGLGGVYDKFAAFSIGGGWYGGCAGAIPNDGESSSASWTAAHVHELGHDFGLYHITGCDAPAGACQGPNAADCSQPDKRDFIMTYCYIFAKYGPAGYQYMKTNPLAPFLKGC